MLRMYESSSAGERLNVAREFIAAQAPAAEVLLVGASRDALDELVRERTIAARATFGLRRTTLTQLAVGMAAPELARRGLVPATELGNEAVVARAIFEARKQNSLSYFAPIASCPGFTRAVAATALELRMAGIAPALLDRLAECGRDLAALLREVECQLEQAAIADRAIVFEVAAAVARRQPPPAALLFLDVALRSPHEIALVRALIESVPQAIATVPAGDDRTSRAWHEVGAELLPRHAERADASSLARLREFLFADAEPPHAERDEQVTIFSAPGEGRECLEIARRVLRDSNAGVPFDRMAILLRAPESYSGLLQNALRRARIPAYFARGSKRPDPSGRAFIALLACKTEGLSARRFAEYLSFAQVPELDSAGEPPEREAWSPPTHEALGPAGDPARFAIGAEVSEQEPGADTDGAAVVDGTLRAPWQWEKLLVEAAVIGGKDRWLRRLDGLQSQYQLQIAALARDEPESARLAALERERSNLDHLRRFALPVIDTLDALPQRATWGEWLAHLRPLAPRVLRRPERVLAVFAELQPMSAVGPLALDEALAALAERLADLEQEPPARPHGRVFVATPEQARGREFEVVFLPGIAERSFPRKPREDPLLLDEVRVLLSPALVTQDDRANEERLLLRLAAGSANRRLYLSYPRIEVTEGRPRVPSFYALDVERATRGRIPDLDQLEREAAQLAAARLAWPAPRDPDQALDDVEHDLAVLGPLLAATDATDRKGRAHYLLKLHAPLARSLRARWSRWRAPWTTFDGLVRATEATQPVLAAHRLAARPYSVSALQKHATCPYQFLLAAIHRLEPRAEAVPLERLDPLTRGSMFHRMQAEFFRAREGEAHALELQPELQLEHRLLDQTVDRIAEEYREDLKPAIERVWHDEVDAMRSDLHAWLERMLVESREWQPIRFELSFGLPIDATRDPRSLRDPVKLPDGCTLRGAIDLVERKRNGQGLRVTDHKTGTDRTKPGLVIGGGEVLQPVLYSYAAEAALGEKVVESRLYFCTLAGQFNQHRVPLGDEARGEGARVLQLIDGAIATGFLPPYPRKGACTYCDFRLVCGPYEEIRAERKDDAPMKALLNLRGRP